MRFSNVRLLVKDFAKCFKFYTEQLGLEPSWGDENSGYANFKVADGIEGFTLFVSDWMAPAVGNADKQQPVAMREKLMVSFSVDNLDETFADLTYIIHSGFISGYQNRYGDNLKPPTNVYHRMTA